jgi:hypothetical protein
MGGPHGGVVLWIQRVLRARGLGLAVRAFLAAGRLAVVLLAPPVRADLAVVLALLGLFLALAWLAAPTESPTVCAA